jgi:curved DNA-binding protein CbpA
VGRIQDRYQENQALTHYDDLGLPAGASEQEIREAYLNLLRLLHPDLQDTPSLKRFADFQMKRVSRAYAVLADRDRRLRYGRTGGGGERFAVALHRRAGGWRPCSDYHRMADLRFAGVVGIGWYVNRPAVALVTPSRHSSRQCRTQYAIGTTELPRRGQGRRRPAVTGATIEVIDPDPVNPEIAARRPGAIVQSNTIHQAKELDFLSSLILARPPRPPEVQPLLRRLGTPRPKVGC